jgi:hypothetical protein
LPQYVKRIFNPKQNIPANKGGNFADTEIGTPIHRLAMVVQ